MRLGGGEITAQCNAVCSGDLQLRIVGVHLDGCAKCNSGAGVIADLQQCGREIGLEHPISRLHGRGASDEIDGAPGITALQREHACQVERIGVPRVQRKSLIIKVVCFFQPPGLVVGEPFPDEILDG